MFDPDRSNSMSFDFFRKRKAPRKKPKISGYTSPSVGSLSDSAQFSSQNIRRSSDSGSKRGTFRGLLKDCVKTKSLRVNSPKYDEYTDEFVPELPKIDNNACKAVNYMTWARDQMVFGNEEILYIPHLESRFMAILNDLKSQQHSRRSSNSGVAGKIMEIVYERMTDVEAGYSYLSNNKSPYCCLSSVYLNAYVFVRPVDFSDFDFSLNVPSSSVILEGEKISDNVFLNQRLLPSFSKHVEFLPSKFSPEYIYKKLPVENDYVANMVTKVIFQRTTRQLIVVKAVVDIPGIDLSNFEGFCFCAMKTGEKAWLPIYVCEKLSHFGYVTVDLPVFLMKATLCELRRREQASIELEKLPNDYFFEIAFIFTKSKMFKKLHIPQLKNRNHIYSYISKVSGIVEDIRCRRISKIRRFLESLSMSNSVIYVNNLQYSETFFINQFLPAYCSLSERRKKFDTQPRMQIDHLIGDLENALMDSLRNPIM